MKIAIQKNGALIVYINHSIVKLLNLEAGQKFYWKVNDDLTLTLIKRLKNQGDIKKTYQIRKKNNSALVILLPTAIYHALGMSSKHNYDWEMRHSRLVLKRIKTKVGEGLE